MRPLSFVLRVASRESPLVLGQEFIWRIRKKWRRARFAPLPSNGRCPVRFRLLPGLGLDSLRLSEQNRAGILGVANLLCEGRFPLLSYGTIALGRSPRWNLDFVSGKDWPMIPADRLTIVRFDGSDVKVPWELSRLQFLPILGCAYRLRQEERYRDAARAITLDWIDRNPTGTGVNWTIAMEAALRALSLLFLVQHLWPMRPDEQGWLDRVTRSLWDHLLFIEAHLEFSHLVRGNHYFSNLVGLLGLALFLDGEGMEERRSLYARQVEREIRHQVREDGGDFEASAGYHVLVIQMCTTALLMMRAAGMQPASSFESRLRQMYRWLRIVADDRGRLPHFGDCDDGRVQWLPSDLGQMLNFPLVQRDSLFVTDLLSVEAMLWPADSGSCADGEGQEPNRVSPAGWQWKQETSKVDLLPESGIAVVRHAGAQIHFFNMPNGIHGKGSHTHNDKLSVCVRLGGEEWLCDSGTGSYTRDLQRRNSMRSTAAHNTVRVDRLEQNSISSSAQGVFALGNEAGVGPITLETSPQHCRLKASHFGYKRAGIVHTRVLTWSRGSELTIEDEVAGQGRHSVQANFLLGPAWRVDSVHRQDAETVCRLAGPRRAEICFSALVPLEVNREVVQVSRLFGCYLDIVMLSVRLDCMLPVTVRTILRWES